LYTEEKIWHLIARALNHEATPEEKEQLAAVLRRDESLQQQYDLLSRIWKEKHGSIDEKESDAAKNIISRIIYKAELEGRDIPEMPVVRRRSNNRIWIAAASVMLIA
jgi:hypothetical protein